MFSVSSVYIHIPFCSSKCHYCDFFSVPVDSVPDDYIQSLLQELDFHILSGHFTKLKTLYIGGGTPSLLTCSQIEKILAKLRPFFSDDYEATMEMNPESVSMDFLDFIKNNGINRVSLGVQSLNDSTLSCVNRCANSVTTINALQLICASGLSFSADLIAGLPLQTDDVFVNGLKTVISYKPSHISLYALTITEGTILDKRIQLKELICPTENIDSQWILGRYILEESGFYQYEVSNFAPKGNESKHNSVYWKQESYIGIGAGASSSVYFYNNEILSKGLRYTNTENIENYISFWLKKSIEKKDFQDCSIMESFLPVNFLGEIEILDKKTLAFEFCMLGLRLLKGINTNEYFCRFGEKLNIDLFKEYEKKSLVFSYIDAANEQWFSMGKKGILFLNQFLEDLLEEY